VPSERSPNLAANLAAQLAQHRAALGDRPFEFEHGLHGDARFARGQLAELVGRVPCAWVLAHEAQFSPHERRGKAKLPADADLVQAIVTLPTAGVSIRAYNLEHTTDFRPLLDELTPIVRDFVGDREGGLSEVNLATFLASAGAVTAAHPDRHHNLLLNVDGRKEVWVDTDPDTRGHHVRTLDYFRRPDLGAPELPPAEQFVLEPGQGVYIPPYRWHWTRVLDDCATGFSVGFSTATTDRNNRVLGFDMRLRALGVRPRPFDMHGDGGVTGRVKAGLSPVVARAARLRPRRGGSLVVSGDPQEVAR